MEESSTLCSYCGVHISWRDYARKWVSTIGGEGTCYKAQENGYQHKPA